MLVFKVIGNDLYPEIDQSLIKELIDFYNQIMVYRIYLDAIDADNITFGEYRTNRIRMRKNIIPGILVESTIPGEVFLLSGNNYEKYILSLYSQQIVFDPNRSEYFLISRFPQTNPIQSFDNLNKLPLNSQQSPLVNQKIESQSCYPHYVPPPKDNVSRRTSLVKFSSCQP